MSQVQFWKEIVITQICTGSVSLIASSTIVTFIASSGGLKNPYRRLIFGLSISDILLSFGIVAGPFLAPSDTPQARWGMGNKQTCRVVGLTHMIGSSTVPLYTLCLCIYYVCKLKVKMTDVEFSERLEKKMHLIIVTSNLGLYLTALAMDTINPMAAGNICLSAPMPTGCSQNPQIYGECDPDIDAPATFFSFVNFIALPIACIICIICSLIIIFWHAVMREKIFGRANSGFESATSLKDRWMKWRNRYISSNGCQAISEEFNHGNASKVDSQPCPSFYGTKDTEHMEDQVRPHLPSIQEERCDDSFGIEQNDVPTEEIGTELGSSKLSKIARAHIHAQQLDRNEEIGLYHEADYESDSNAAAAVFAHRSSDLEALSQLYKRELVTQACCYVLVFLLTAGPSALLVLNRTQPSRTLMRICTIFYPLTGLFNIIVYTRWNVAGFRRKHPECSRLQGFWLTLKACGEMPSDDEWNETSVWRLWNCYQRHNNVLLVPPISKLDYECKESISDVQFGISPNISSSSSPGFSYEIQDEFKKCNHLSSIQSVKSSEIFDVSGGF